MSRRAHMLRVLREAFRLYELARPHARPTERFTWQILGDRSLFVEQAAGPDLDADTRHILGLALSVVVECGDGDFAGALSFARRRYRERGPERYADRVQDVTLTLESPSR